MILQDLYEKSCRNPSQYLLTHTKSSISLHSTDSCSITFPRFCISTSNAFSPDLESDASVAFDVVTFRRRTSNKTTDNLSPPCQVFQK